MNCCPYPVASFNNSVQLDTLLRHVMPIVPEVPHAMGLDRIRQAYTEFARRSGLLVAKIVQDYQGGVNDYAITPPDGYEIYGVMGLESPGYSFVDYWKGCNYGLWNTRFDVIDNTSIYLHRASSIDIVDGLVIYATVLPSPCVTTIPASIATPYGKGIAAGAIADLLMVPNKAWTSPQIAAAHKMEFNRVVLSAKQLAETNRKAGPLRMKPIRVI